jgi:hypothetical protein
VVWLRQTLTAGESDPENASGHAFELQVADDENYFVTDIKL